MLCFFQWPYCYIQRSFYFNIFIHFVTFTGFYAVAWPQFVPRTTRLASGGVSGRLWYEFADQGSVVKRRQTRIPIRLSPDSQHA